MLNKKNYQNFLISGIIFLGLESILRLFLIFQYKTEISLTFLNLLKIFISGFYFDALTLLYFIAIPTLYYLIIPYKIFYNKWHKKFLLTIFFIWIYIIVFSIFAEIVFFDEFDARFNFIAVDYLIYTTEVIDNIVESYPIFYLLLAIFIIASCIFFGFYKKIYQPINTKFKQKLIFASWVYLIILCDIFFIDNQKIHNYFQNNYNKEISQNGIYQLFSAYRNNQIDFDKFYLNIDSKQALHNIRNLLKSQQSNSEFIDEDSIYRKIIANPKKKTLNSNIIIVVMESMSGDYMKYFGNSENLTPNLDELAKKSLFFTNLKATGTRTVRGLEAISLSIPPTPGNSIVRRPNNENLFTILSPLKSKNYEGKFIYGGDGYFDNMNYFFASNSFKIIDRNKFQKNEITFNNAWGVADEDLFNKTIKEADASFANKNPFLNIILTTSNHRPFTYPDNKIDIPSKTSRDGAVKYADFAIGEFIKNAKNKPWFDNTIFVFIADHCAKSAGKTDVPLWRYDIPAIIYAPKIISPQIYSNNASQIDIVPTIFGILNFDYNSKFFGVDLLNNNKTKTSRSFVSTYSELGYFINNKLYLLKLKKNKKIYDVAFEKYGFNGTKETPTTNFSQSDLDNAISYYQTAFYQFQNNKLKE